MPRPCCLRHIGCTPNAGFFRPAGVPVCALEQVTLTLDEVEALRLADLNGLYQEQAAEQMGISRSTFSRIVEQARRKVADALIHGKALRLEGGVVRMEGETKMPGRDGTGPGGMGRGMGRGSCGCGRGRGRATRGSMEITRHDKPQESRIDPAGGDGSQHETTTEKKEQKP